jgi:hypothetical protein
MSIATSIEVEFKVLPVVGKLPATWECDAGRLRYAIEMESVQTIRVSHSCAVPAPKVKTVVIARCRMLNAANPDTISKAAVNPGTKGVPTESFSAHPSNRDEEAIHRIAKTRNKVIFPEPNITGIRSATDKPAHRSSRPRHSVFVELVIGYVPTTMNFGSKIVVHDW